MSVSREAIDAAAEAERILASGEPDSLTRGGARVQDAADLGSPQAITRLAHFRAAGVLDKADWDGAVDLLQRAAELGWTPALNELRVLAGSDGETPSELRARVDIHAWIAPKPTRVVNDAPRIRTIDAFMSDEECAWMMSLGQPKLARASVYDNQARGSQVVQARSNKAAALVLLDMDVVTVFLTARMANTIGLPNQWFEPPAVLHYSPGEEFTPHFDFLSPSVPGQAAELKRGGQRIATLLTYLNDGYEGGETDFPRLGYRFKGRAGDALVFANVEPSGAPDSRTMHAGLPPTSGEKWLLSQWIRDRNAQ
jgi:prolyl 4-hydroxylase